MTGEINLKGATNKFLAQISGNLGAYMEACLHCGACADACHFYEVTKDPRYTPAYKLFPMARAYKRSKPPLSWFGTAPKTTEKDLREWEELLFDSCTMCGRCTMVCPMGIDIASIVAWRSCCWRRKMSAIKAARSVSPVKSSRIESSGSKTITKSRFLWRKSRLTYC